LRPEDDVLAPVRNPVARRADVPPADTAVVRLGLVGRKHPPILAPRLASPILATRTHVSPEAQKVDEERGSEMAFPLRNHPPPLCKSGDAGGLVDAGEAVADGEHVCSVVCGIAREAEVMQPGPRDGSAAAVFPFLLQHPEAD